ncbi:MAG: hypothetical protein ACM3PW_11880 [Chlamydiota bacterium]
MARKSRVLTDHDDIQRWAEERDAQPACVRGTGSAEDVGMIRLDFPGYSGETSLESIEWDEWFQKFDDNNLALLVEDEMAGGEQSNFNKIIGRETAAARAQGRKTSRRAERGEAGETRETGRRSASAGRRGAKGGRSRSAAARATSSRSSRSARSASGRGTSSRSRSSRSRTAAGKKRAQSARGNARSRSRRRAA